MCILSVEVLGNHLSQPGSSYCGPGNVSHFFWKEYCIVINSFGRSEVCSQNYTELIVCGEVFRKVWYETH